MTPPRKVSLMAGALACAASRTPPGTASHRRSRRKDRGEAQLRLDANGRRRTSHRSPPEYWSLAVPRLFSAYVIVDWSASSKPNTGADSVWIGVLRRDVRFRMAFESFNPPTRGEGEKRLALILDDLKKRSERALVGFDFPLGFPRGFASAL